MASHEFSPSENKMKEQIVSADFCKVLVSKLSDPFIQVRYNAVSAVINLIICYSECDMDAIFLFSADLLPAIETVMMEYRTNMDMNIKYSEGEQAKINKLIKNIVDLLLLLMDLYDTGEYKDYNKLNIEILMNISVNFIMNPGFLDEDVILNFVMLTASFFTLRVVKINNNNILLNFIQFAENIVFDENSRNKANVLVVACFTSIIFYFYCSNINIDNNTELDRLKLVDRLIEMIYQNINFNLATQIEDLNMNIQNFVKHTGQTENTEMITENDADDKHSEVNSDIKKRIKNTENYIRATLMYLKTFTDIINSIELNLTNKNLNSSLSLNDDEIDEELEEEDSADIVEGKSEIEKNVSNVINYLFQNTNYELLQKMLNKIFLENLINFFNNLTIEEFLLSDFDKMIKVKELLYDLEYYTLSLINNILQNISNIYGNTKYHINLINNIANEYSLLGTITNMIIKRLQIEEYSKNQDFLSVMLTCFRSILEKYKNINEIINFTNFDFKFLFVILNNNVDDRFIKINIIDVIAFLFSYKGHSAEANLEICKLLYSMCMNENDMEVTSHVLNAFYDIYGEDDFNFNLKSVGVIDAMKYGVNEFRSRVNLFSINYFR